MKIKKLSEIEFISIMASLMALSAVSIDALLPGLNEIGNSIGITDSKDNQLLIITIFLGLGFGQLVSGPISDSFGRKPIVYIGFIVFALASLLCIFSTNIEIMLIGRFFQGIGLSAPRTISVAIIRDRFSGDYMARIMSFVTVIFILAPVLAPTIGKILLDSFGWESIFISQIVLGLIVITWLWKRQPETLKLENRKDFKLSLFIDGSKEFFKYKSAIIFTVIAGLISAPFLAYLSSSQQIFQEQYNLINEFPYIFSGLALGIGIATYFNGTLVVRFGMLRMATIPLSFLTIISLAYIIFYKNEVNPSIGILIFFLALILFSMGFIFGNINAIAMQPIGHIAGIGAAILGFISTIIAVSFATFIGSYIYTTAIPIFMGFAASGTLSLMLILFYNLSNKKETKTYINKLQIEPAIISDKIIK